MKKFEIQGQGNDKKKKFEIQPKKFVLRKKFEIQSTEPSEQAWFHQENDNDCGPCMILNILNQLGVNGPSSIREVREQVNEIRRNSQPPMRSLSENDWFTSDDVGKYLSVYAGLNVEEYVCFADAEQDTFDSIQNNINTTPYEVLYTTSGRHFKAIVKSGDSVLLLDSFQNSPQTVNLDRINSLIRENVFSKRSDSPDRVGIVRTNRESEYKTFSF